MESGSAKGIRRTISGLEKVPFASEATLGIDIFATSIASRTRTHALTKTSSNTLPFLLHHFSSSAFATLSSYTGQRIMKEQVPVLAMQFPFLLDTILAFSASHVTYLGQKRRSTASDRREMSVAAAWHTLKALRGYGETISDYHGEQQAVGRAANENRTAASQHDLRATHDERQQLDALVAACIMLTSLFYHVDWTNDQAHIWSSIWMPDEAEDAITMGKNVSDNINRAKSDNDVTALSFPDNAPPFAFFGGGYSSLYGPAAINRTTRHWSKPKCDWLTNVTGLSILLSLTAFQEHLPCSIWFPFFAEANEDHRNDPLAEQVSGQTVRVPSAENSLQANTSTERNRRDFSSDPCDVVNPPLEPPEPERMPQLRTLLLLTPQLQASCGPLIAHLASLLALSPSNLNNFSQIISFPARFSPNLPPLVASRHVIALLILGYWFGLLEEVPHWWSRERGRAEGMAIQGWLVNLVQSSTKMAKGWGALRESGADRQWREGSAGAVNEFVAWRKARNLG